MLILTFGTTFGYINYPLPYRKFRSKKPRKFPKKSEIGSQFFTKINTQKPMFTSIKEVQKMILKLEKTKSKIKKDLGKLSLKQKPQIVEYWNVIDEIDKEISNLKQIAYVK